MKEMERALSTSVVRRPRLLPGVRESSNRAHSVPKFAKIPSYAFSASNGPEPMRGCRAQQPAMLPPAGGSRATSACATPSLPVLEPPPLLEELETQILKEPVIVWEDLETPKELLLEKTPPLLDILTRV